MTNAQRYFIVAAETLNISRAAKALFISQQCLSAHIKKLEEQYGVRMFERKPHLKLTPAGDMLYSSLRQIQLLESSLDRELERLTQAANETLTIGMHTWRARAILPAVLPRFSELCPEIKLKVLSHVTNDLERMLIDRSVDIIIVRARSLDDRIESIDLINERNFLAISDELLRRHFADRWPQCREEFSRGVDLAEFRDVPFILGLESSNVYADVLECLAKEGITPHCRLQTNISEMHAGIQGLDYGAGICPEGLCRLLAGDGGMAGTNLFPLKDDRLRNRIKLAWLRSVPLPEHAKRFREIVTQLFRDCGEV